MSSLSPADNKFIADTLLTARRTRVNFNRQLAEAGKATDFVPVEDALRVEHDGNGDGAIVEAVETNAH